MSFNLSGGSNELMDVRDTEVLKPVGDPPPNKGCSPSAALPHGSNRGSAGATV